MVDRGLRKIHHYYHHLSPSIKAIQNSLSLLVFDIVNEEEVIGEKVEDAKKGYKRCSTQTEEVLRSKSSIRRANENGYQYSDENVLVSNEPLRINSSKLEPKFHGPYKIVKKISPLAYLN